MSSKVRVLYSFPHKLGASRICYTAWEQVRGIVAAGAEVTLYAGCVVRDVPPTVEVHTTLSRGKLRIPYKLIGSLRALALHDWIVSRALPKLKDRIDVVHVWPSSALRTIRVAKQLGIPTVLERPNSHTRFALEVVAAERKRIGIGTPNYDYRPREKNVRLEEAEFAECDFLLCASEFSAKTFTDRGYPASKILRHKYGFDESRFIPLLARDPKRPFTALFVGVDAVRKGLHLALEAWLASPASRDGLFQIAGDVQEEFKLRFVKELSHPSVLQLGNRDDIPDLMQQADILLMPTIEEGFALVCAEAIGAGCVPLASDACTEMCRHMENSLVHHVGDVATLCQQITDLHSNPALLARLRAGTIATRADWTWARAGQVLAGAYDEAVARSFRTTGLSKQSATNA
jgi:glycosyltransferase involved in cell wall biosynthesis